jgi:preprotein translocase subunit SecF
MIEIIKNANIDFIGKRKYGFVFSAVGILLSLILIFAKGPNFGIDFTGGALLQIRFSEPITTGELRNTLSKVGKEQALIQALGVEGKEYLIRATSRIFQISKGNSVGRFPG